MGSSNRKPGLNPGRGLTFQALLIATPTAWPGAGLGLGRYSTLKFRPPGPSGSVQPQCIRHAPLPLTNLPRPLCIRARRIHCFYVGRKEIRNERNSDGDCACVCRGFFLRAAVYFNTEKKQKDEIHRCAQGNPGQPEEIVTYRLGLSRRNAGLPTRRCRRRFTARADLRRWAEIEHQGITL